MSDLFAYAAAVKPVVQLSLNRCRAKLLLEPAIMQLQVKIHDLARGGNATQTHGIAVWVKSSTSRGLRLLANRNTYSRRRRSHYWRWKLRHKSVTAAVSEKGRKMNAKVLLVLLGIYVKFEQIRSIHRIIV